jgi:hypothetical protein
MISAGALNALADAVRDVSAVGWAAGAVREAGAAEAVLDAAADSAGGSAAASTADVARSARASVSADKEYADVGVAAF